MASHPDPYRSFRFRVEIDSTIEGGFQMVSGLERISEFEPYREGGVNDFEHQLVTRTTFSPVVLTRGLYSTALWDWHQAVIDGLTIERRTISIVLLDEAGAEEKWRWICRRALPAKWTGAELDAISGNVATETVELVHEGMRRQ
jgi:phage tail-like protein